jgi:hypothetical protein
MQCRQRKMAEEVEITSLIAWSDSRFMWPLARYHACNVLDPGDSIWNSGKFAPASIQVKLTDRPQHVSRVELQVEMSPLRACVHHQILAGLTPSSMHVVGCIKGIISHGQWIHVAVNNKVQFLEIATLQSPSFVAWKRLRVYGRVASDQQDNCQ